jgi:hypothetical protein
MKSLANKIYYSGNRFINMRLLFGITIVLLISTINPIFSSPLPPRDYPAIIGINPTNSTYLYNFRINKGTEDRNIIVDIANNKILNETSSVKTIAYYKPMNYTSSTTTSYIAKNNSIVWSLHNQSDLLFSESIKIERDNILVGTLGQPMIFTFYSETYSTAYLVVATEESLGNNDSSSHLFLKHLDASNVMYRNLDFFVNPFMIEIFDNLGIFCNQEYTFEYSANYIAYNQTSMQVIIPYTSNDPIILSVVSQLLPLSDLSFDESSIEFTINSNDILINLEIDPDDLSIIFDINGYDVYKINTPYLLPVVESLSVSQSDKNFIDTSMYLSFLAALGAIPIGIFASEREKAVVPYIGILLTMQTWHLVEIYLSASDKQDTASYIATALETTGDAHLFGMLEMVALFSFGLIHLSAGMAALGSVILIQEYMAEMHIDGFILNLLGLNEIVNHNKFDQRMMMDIGQLMYMTIGLVLAGTGIASSTTLPAAALNAFFALLEFVGVLTLWYFILTIIFGLLAK